VFATPEIVKEILEKIKPTKRDLVVLTSGATFGVIGAALLMNNPASNVNSPSVNPYQLSTQIISTEREEGIPKRTEIPLTEIHNQNYAVRKNPESILGFSLIPEKEIVEVYSDNQMNVEGKSLVAVPTNKSKFTSQSPGEIKAINVNGKRYYFPKVGNSFVVIPEKGAKITRDPNGIITIENPNQIYEWKNIQQKKSE
jgi:hypothetical protein